MFRLFGLLLVGLVSQSNLFVAVASERTTITCTVKGSGVSQWTSASVKKSIQLEIEKYFVKSLSSGRAVFYLDGPSAITSLFGPHALQISPQCNNCWSPEHPSHKVTAELFKNGSMNLTKNSRRWFKYECNKNSIDVLAVLDGSAKKGTSSTTNTQSGVNYTSSKQVASSSTTQSKTPSSAELTAAQKEAERLRQELAALKVQQEQHQQTISSDNQKPVINIAGTAMNGPQGTIKGYVRDNTGIAEVRVDGQLVEVDSYGNFMANTYVPQSGINVSIEAVDLAGLTSSMSVRLDRLTSSSSAAITFDRLNPLGRNVASNKDALALIIGVNEYAKTPAKAHYADSDAQVFSDYAIQKLGIPANRVKTLVNNNADESGMLLAVKDWLARANRQGKSDIYVFFAGHGLASDDGEKMYLLPYDGSPRLLSDTAISRERLFADISAANPRSVTVFLDTCYSGTTRGTDMLIASRPIAIRALEQSIPDNFTVMTAAAGDQTAKPLEEAKHGMFSYFLMKGMEGGN